MGDGDPFPVARHFVTLTGEQIGSKELGIATYSATQMGETVFVYASGETQFGVDVSLEQGMLTVFPPEFGLYFIKPMFVLPAQKPFAVSASFRAVERVSSVRVHDAKGVHEVEVVADKQGLTEFAFDHGNP